MLTIPRSLARQLRTVFRRCAPRSCGPPPPTVEFRTAPDGLSARLCRPEVAVEYNRPGDYPSAAISLPLAALADFEGGGKDDVTLEQGSAGKVLARWQDGAVPRAAEYDAPGRDPQPEFPSPPGRLVRNPPGLLRALDEAAHSAATPPSARFGTHRILLRGRGGAIVATDGRQLLIQSGFTFPWADDLLVPALPVFACRELGEVPHVEVGRAEGHVVFRLGAWAFWLRVDDGARYPDFAKVVPPNTEGGTVWRIDPEDATFLAGALPRLPGRDDDHQPLTVDLDEHVRVRARAAGQARTTELELARSASAGRPLRFCVDRRLVARLLHLGFSEVRITDPEAPFVCRDAARTFVGMPLGKSEALGPADDALRLASADSPSPPRPPSPERRKRPVSTPHDNGHGASGAGPRTDQSPEEQSPSSGFAAAIEEAQALRTALRDAYRRSSGLVASLRRFRQQSRAVASTLASLRQLRRLEP
jgi:hypothetical protein